MKQSTLQVAVTNLTVSRAGTSPASFRGSRLSRADARGTLSRVQGKLSGSALDGGGVYNADSLHIGGAAQVSGNIAAGGYGGGINSTGTSVTFSGTEVRITKNRKALPSYEGSWYRALSRKYL